MEIFPSSSLYCQRQLMRMLVNLLKNKCLRAAGVDVYHTSLRVTLWERWQHTFTSLWSNLIGEGKNGVHEPEARELAITSRKKIFLNKIKNEGSFGRREPSLQIWFRQVWLRRTNKRTNKRTRWPTMRFYLQTYKYAKTQKSEIR